MGHPDFRVAGQIFWGRKTEDPHFQHLPDAQGPEWAALGILVFVLVLFGVAPGIAIGPVDTATAPLLERLPMFLHAVDPVGQAVALSGQQVALGQHRHGRQTAGTDLFASLFLQKLQEFT